MVKAAERDPGENISCNQAGCKETYDTSVALFDAYFDDKDKEVEKVKALGASGFPTSRPAHIAQAVWNVFEALAKIVQSNQAYYDATIGDDLSDVMDDISVKYLKLAGTADKVAYLNGIRNSKSSGPTKTDETIIDNLKALYKPQPPP